MKFWVGVTLCATLLVGCGGADSGKSNSSSNAATSLTTEEQAAVSRYVVDADHVNTTARNCAGPSIVKNVGASRLDEFTKGAPATEKEAALLFDLFANCVKWNGLLLNAMMANLRRTDDQAKCVHEKGPTNDDVKPLAMAVFQKKAAPPLSASAQKKYQDALAQCIPQ